MNLIDEQIQTIKLAINELPADQRSVVNHLVNALREKAVTHPVEVTLAASLVCCETQININ